MGISFRALLLVCLMSTFSPWSAVATSDEQQSLAPPSIPSVEITRVPLSGADNPEKLYTIKGRVSGAAPGQQIILYAKAETAWWVQPFADQPFTKIEGDFTWSNSTHPGREYAALLVGADFHPPLTTQMLPTDGVFATAVVTGQIGFWQRWWFPLSCILVGALLIWGYHRLRMRQMGNKLKLRFEERLAERTRIAQELHDTLLQGVISASMQLHVVADQIPVDSPAKPAVGRVLDLMGRVVEEGRRAVSGLRSTQIGSLDLGRAFSQMEQEYAGQKALSFHVIEEGTLCPLNPIIRDEIYSIGREALTNAFRHSKADKIEVELEYASTGLRVLVRDSGVGFDPKLLQFGRDGHWGLSGMRERAKRINARLRVWSRPAAGTEVELTVPANIAFVSKPPRGVSKWISKLLPKGRQMFEES